MKKYLIVLLSLLFIQVGTKAQSVMKIEKDKFDVRLRGRILLDGGVFIDPDGIIYKDAVLSDMRLGANIKFLDYWNIMMEVGYANNKVSLKDVYINYTTGDNSVQIGYFFEPYGESRFGTTVNRLIAESQAAKAFTTGRKLGVTYQYASDNINVTSGIFSLGSINSDNNGQAGYSFTTKVLGRPIFEQGKVLHFSVTPSFSSLGKNYSSLVYAAGIPTSLISNNQFTKATISNVTNSWRFEYEALGLIERWYGRASFYTSTVNRYDATNFFGNGFVLESGFLIIGDQQKYNAKGGYIVNPAAGSLEVIARYDYLDLNDNEAGVNGGIGQNFSIGGSYYINKYITARLNYVYSKSSLGFSEDATHANLIQGRLQFAF